MFGELLPVGGGDPIPLNKPRLLVGRRDSCDIALRFPNVSSRHCELEMSEGYWRVRDLGSSNHTRVNGQRVSTKWILPGDELTIARHKFTISYIPQSSGPPPEDEGEDISIGLLEKAGLAVRDEPPPQRRNPLASAGSSTSGPNSGRTAANSSNTPNIPPVAARQVSPPVRPVRQNDDEDAAFRFLIDEDK